MGVPKLVLVVFVIKIFVHFFDPDFVFVVYDGFVDSFISGSRGLSGRVFLSWFSSFL